MTCGRSPQPQAGDGRVGLSKCSSGASLQRALCDLSTNRKHSKGLDNEYPGCVVRDVRLMN